MRRIVILLTGLALTMTAAPRAHAACAGDCGGDDTVTIEELIALVRIALGEAAATTCAAGDGNGDGAVAIDELVLAVSRALNGCA